MKTNTLVLFLFFAELCGRIARCSQLSDQVGGPDENNLVFALPNAKADDYIIEKTPGTDPVYKFGVKPGKTISEVTFNDKAFWKKSGDLALKNLFVYSKNKSPAAFGLELQRDNESDYIHYKVDGVVQPVSMVQFFDAVDSDKFAGYRADHFSFDLVSMFDRRFHKVTAYASDDFKTTIFLFHPYHGWFDKVYDDSKLIFEVSGPEKIDTIKLVMEGVTRLLLQLGVSIGHGLTNKNFKYDKTWSEISEFDFNSFYVDRNYGKIKNLLTSTSVRLPVKAYDINNTATLETTMPENIVFLTLPTLVNRFDRLLKLTESRTDISTEPMDNVVVYLYRGAFSTELIEIVRLGADTSRERLENLYFVKSKGVWAKTGQTLFLERVKALVSANVNVRGRGEAHVAAANSLDLGFFGSPLPDFDFSKEFGPQTAFEREKAGKEAEKEKADKKDGDVKQTESEKEKERLKQEEFERQKEKDRIKREKEDREKEMERLNREQKKPKSDKGEGLVQEQKKPKSDKGEGLDQERDKSKGDDKGADKGAVAASGGAAAGRPDTTGIAQAALQPDGKPQVPEPSAKKSGFVTAPLAGVAVVALALACASV